jgi:S1-C subfamily serine protease
MKFRTLLLASLLASPLAIAASGPLKDKALALSAAHKESVVQLSATVEIEVTAGENPTKKEEKKLETTGTVLNKDGLIVVPLSTLDVASAVDGRTVNTPNGPIKLSAKSSTKEMKIIMADGTEAPAKVVFKDTDLDLAFIRPEKPEGLTFVPIDTANNAPLAMLDDVIVLGRLSKELNREPLIMTTEIMAMVTKPRTFGRIGAPCLGLPVFNAEGKFVGLGVNRFAPKSDALTGGGAPASNVVLPAADVLEVAAQAK